MRSVVILTALLLAVYGTSAKAEYPYQCDSIKGVDDIQTHPNNGVDCIDGLKKVIEQQRKGIDLAWRASADPTVLLSVINPTDLRGAQTPAAWFQRAYDQLMGVLGGTHEGDDVFLSLRGKYSDPTALSELYDRSKATLETTIGQWAVRGVVGDLLKAGNPLFKKPLTFLAAEAGDWYWHACATSEAQTEEDATYCKKHESFSRRFKEEYGVAPTPGSAWVLAFLYRRHQEGGAALVSQWQEIGLNLSDDLGVNQPQ